jgi:hypothetical protein
MTGIFLPTPSTILVPEASLVLLGLPRLVRNTEIMQKHWRMKDFGHTGLSQFYHEARSFPVRESSTDTILELRPHGTRMHNGNSL